MAGAGVNCWIWDADPGLEGQACWLSLDCRPGPSASLSSAPGWPDGAACPAGAGLPLPWPACLPATCTVSACGASPCHEQTQRSDLILYITTE